jgi:lysophospholipase L1-like esterase
MDHLMKSYDPKGPTYKAIIRSFIRELRSRGPVQIIWVLPPDASKYRPAIKDSVDRWIKDSARELNFQTIDSRALTSRYIPGKSGSDGVHLSDSAASEWATAVTKRLKNLSPAFQ